MFSMPCTVDELRHLAGHLGVVERIQRVLVLHLRNQQAEKAVLRCLGAVAGVPRRYRTGC